MCFYGFLAKSVLSVFFLIILRSLQALLFSGKVDIQRSHVRALVCLPVEIYDTNAQDTRFTKAEFP